MNTLYFRNFIITAGMVLLSFFIVGLAFVLLGRGFLVSERREDMAASAREVVKSANAFSQDGDFRDWELRMTLSSIARTTGNHIFITDDEGVIISCSDMQVACPHIGTRLPDNIMLMLSVNGVIDQISDLGGFYKDTYYVIGLPVVKTTTNETVGYVFVASNSGTLMDAWRAFLAVFAGVAGLVLLLAVVFSFIASKKQAKPLNEMAAASRRFARGDFSVRVEDDGREDEIGELTASFNAMAESLERSEELRRDFVANVSHELKTPMTTIAGFADGILDGTIPPENQAKYLNVISSETKRLSRLVRSMLELSRIQAADAVELRKKTMDISEVLRRTLLGLEHKITERSLDVCTQLPEDSMLVLGDEDGITQVVYNLLDNAIKFSSPGGVLTLTLWKQGGKAYVSVKNQGETIAPDELPVIFDRFHKTDRSRSRDREGVGLGLYIVKTILGNHDEDIFVRSQDGETEFVFTLTLKE